MEHENRHHSETGGQHSGLYNHVVCWKSDQGVSGSIWFAQVGPYFCPMAKLVVLPKVADDIYYNFVDNYELSGKHLFMILFLI